jgi:hypothetical protein
MDLGCDILKEKRKSNGEIKHFHFPEFHYPPPFISPYQLKGSLCQLTQQYIKM